MHTRNVAFLMLLAPALLIVIGFLLLADGNGDNNLTFTLGWSMVLIALVFQILSMFRRRL